MLVERIDSLISQKPRITGQGLSEYTLIGSLITLSAIVGIGLTGNNLSTVFKGLKNDLRDQVEHTASIRSQLASADIKAGNSPSLPQDPNTPLPTSSTAVNSGLSLTMKNGATLDLPNYPSDIAKSVYTLGANGTTNILADSIKTIADTQLANGAITQSQYNTLIALANKGHYIANIEETFQTVAASVGDGSAYFDTVVTVNGQRTNIADLSTELGFRNYLSYDGSLPSDPLKEPAYGDAQDFINLYQSVVKSGALNDPAVKAIVTDAAKQIALITGAVDAARHNFHHGVISSTEFTDNTASMLIHNNSSTICTSGQGVDSGIQCAG